MSDRCATCLGVGMIRAQQGPDRQLVICMDCRRLGRLDHPEHIACIALDHPDLPGQSWCGRTIGFAFHFAGIDHAAVNAVCSGRLVTCPDCLSAIRCAFEANGSSFIAGDYGDEEED